MLIIMIMQRKNIWYTIRQKLLEKFLGSPVYTKNQALVFTVIFLCILGIFSQSKIKAFSYQVKNPTARNIVIAVSKPFIDFAEQLPYEKIFQNTRQEVLKILKLENNYHWDNFYYDKPDFALSAPKQETANLYSDKSAHAPILPNELFLSQKKETTVSTESELLMSNYQYSKKKPLRVLFFGDSQMQSLAEGFKRNVGSDSAFVVTDLAVVSSGFVRTDYYNWPAKLTSIFKQAQAEHKTFDAAVLILGMNDFQNFFDGNGTLFVRGTAEWNAAYTQKMSAVINIVQSNVKKIYWLGLPLVKLPTLNREITAVETAQINAVPLFDSEKLRRISLRNIAPGKDARYSDTIQLDDGKRITFMRDDGIHFTYSGAEFIMRHIETYLYQDFSIKK